MLFAAGPFHTYAHSGCIKSTPTLHHYRTPACHPLGFKAFFLYSIENLVLNKAKIFHGSISEILTWNISIWNIRGWFGSDHSSRVFVPHVYWLRLQKNATDWLAYVSRNLHYCALLQILRSDWLSHRALFVIVLDEHKQDGCRAFYYRILLVIVAILFIINYLNFFVCKFLLKQIVYSLSWSLSG